MESDGEVTGVTGNILIIATVDLVRRLANFVNTLCYAVSVGISNVCRH